MLPCHGTVRFRAKCTAVQVRSATTGSGVGYAGNSAPVDLLHCHRNAKGRSMGGSSD